MNDRLQQQKLRDRRKEAGWKRITIWLDPDDLEALALHDKDWLGTTVKALLKSSLSDKHLISSKGHLSDNYDDSSGKDQDLSGKYDDAGAGFALNATTPVPTELEAKIIAAVKAMIATGGKINRAKISRDCYCDESNVRRVIKKYHLLDAQ
ncbi:hypothetical protein [Chromatium okenii]|jgi:hypothetical protein|uniref:hypothetical protein n=1 Tax=Chromatium okenii TaxID=61644 RepID=UPI0026EFEDDD|nr:hypothetical protein [Chromatium okenii]